MNPTTNQPDHNPTNSRRASFFGPLSNSPWFGSVLPPCVELVNLLLDEFRLFSKLKPTNKIVVEARFDIVVFAEVVE